VQDMIKMYTALCAQYPLFLSDFNKTWNSSTDFLKISNFTEIHPLEAKLFPREEHTDRQTWWS